MFMVLYPPCGVIKYGNANITNAINTFKNSCIFNQQLQYKNH